MPCVVAGLHEIELARKSSRGTFACTEPGALDCIEFNYGEIAGDALADDCTLMTNNSRNFLIEVR